MEKKKKDRFITIILVLILLAGLSLLLYPVLSDYWNRFHQTRAIVSYDEEVSDLNEKEYRAMWEAAREYNDRLAQKGARFALPEEEKQEYEGLLDVSGHGIMGYIEIPVINCTLPIYHGTADSVLQIAAGHLEWSSLPVGGEGSHCVLSGHRGLPSAKLFTNLDQLVEGDIFLLKVLNETLTYEVDQILIVEPEETQALEPVPGEDYCTLVTCTPYGINTHRLLIRGRRIENKEEVQTVHVISDAVRIEPLLVTPVVALPLLLILLVLVFVKDSAKKTGGGEKNAKKHAGNDAKNDTKDVAKNDSGN